MVEGLDLAAGQWHDCYDEMGEGESSRVARPHLSGGAQYHPGMSR